MSSQPPSQSEMPRADFLSGLFFFVIGLYMIVEGMGMPGPAEVSYIEKGGEPGRVPIVVGSAIAIFALLLLIRAIGDGGYRLSPRRELDEHTRSGVIRSATTTVICTVYAVGLLGARIGGWDVSYELATAIFVFVFIIVFDWESAPARGSARWRQIQRYWPAFASRWRDLSATGLTAAAPYLWLIAMALLQSIIVTVAVTYLFEQQFFVTLP